METKRNTDRYMIIDTDQKLYVSVLFIGTPWQWINWNKQKDSAIVYTESELDKVEKVLRKKKINYSLNKIKSNGKQQS